MDWKIFNDTFEEEIKAQEFTLDEAEWMALLKALKVAQNKAPELNELYGRLHQIIELFQAGELSADSYSKYHSKIMDRITLAWEKANA